ncbi:hypothetical protein KCP69_10660 [Salmonella enterica subsp. enterica]|nr:hypothetical protein KCP69_10660 [Salmonella enterica subsp. enterica]
MLNRLLHRRLRLRRWTRCARTHKAAGTGVAATDGGIVSQTGRGMIYAVNTKNFTPRYYFDITMSCSRRHVSISCTF